MGPKLSSAQAYGHPQSECVRVGRASGSHLGARKGQGRLPPPSRSFSPHTRGHQESETSHHGTHGRTQDPAELASPPGDALGVWPSMGRVPHLSPLCGSRHPWGHGRCNLWASLTQAATRLRARQERRFLGQAGDQHAVPGPRPLRRDELAPGLGLTALVQPWFLQPRHPACPAPMCLVSISQATAAGDPTHLPWRGHTGKAADHREATKSLLGGRVQSTGRGETLTAEDAGVCECECVRVGGCEHRCVCAVALTVRLLKMHRNASLGVQGGACPTVKGPGPTAALTAPGAGVWGAACGVFPQLEGVPNPRCGDTYPRWSHTAPSQALRWRSVSISATSADMPRTATATHGTWWHAHSPALALGRLPRHTAAVTPT